MFLFGVETQFVTTWNVEFQRSAAGVHGPCGNLLDLDAVVLDRLLVVVEIGVGFDLVGGIIETRLIGRRENDAVFVPLVPTLEVDVAVLVLMRLDQAQNGTNTAA